jgi:hypothetical protein
MTNSSEGNRCEGGLAFIFLLTVVKSEIFEWLPDQSCRREPHQFSIVLTLHEGQPLRRELGAVCPLTLSSPN